VLVVAELSRLHVGDEIGPTPSLFSRGPDWYYVNIISAHDIVPIKQVIQMELQQKPDVYRSLDGLIRSYAKRIASASIW
jgi:hypothetical protein